MKLQTRARSMRDLAETVEQLVLLRTSNRVRNLKVTVTERSVILTGRTSTYYDKQLATHAALDALENISLSNEIEVC